MILHFYLISANNVGEHISYKDTQHPTHDNPFFELYMEFVFKDTKTQDIKVVLAKNLRPLRKHAAIHNFLITELRNRRTHNHAASEIRTTQQRRQRFHRASHFHKSGDPYFD